MGKISTGSQTRPTFLDLRRIHFPVGAVASILHRLTGVVLLLVVPAALGLVAYSSSSPAHFHQVAQLLDGPLATLGLALILAAVLHHLFAGLRILLMEAGIGGQLPFARRTAWAALILAALGGLGVLVGL